MTDNKSRNRELISLYKEGDKKAFDELIENNLGLVKSAAKHFIDRGVEFDDLVQLGSLGLIKAANAFNPELGYEFSTYAFTMIVGEIRRFLRDDGLIKVSRSTKKNCAILLRAKEKYIAEYGIEPTISTLAELCELSKEEAVFCLGAMNPVVSMNKTDDDTDTSLEDKLGENYIEEYTERIALKEAISTLNDEEKTIIMLRYSAGLTQCDIAKRLNTSQVKISRTEKKILEKLKKFLT